MLNVFILLIWFIFLIAADYCVYIVLGYTFIELEVDLPGLIIVMSICMTYPPVPKPNAFVISDHITLTKAIP